MNQVDVLEAKFVASAPVLTALPAPVSAEVAFAGRSNVGKSSLINSLVQRKKLVRTSSTPGCTRAIQLFRIRLRGDAVLDLVDLPGYGFARRSKSERRGWGQLIESFLRERAGLRAVVVIVDVRRGLEEDDADLIEFLRALGRRAIVVATKTDKLPASKVKPTLAALRKESGERVIGYSAPKAAGRDELWAAILGAADIAT